jgi:hypothetical protein
MRPPGVVSVGLHALGMENLGWCSFSGRAAFFEKPFFRDRGSSRTSTIKSTFAA